MKPQWTVGERLGAAALAISILAATMAYGSLRTQVSANKQALDGLLPAVSSLAISVGEFAVEVKYLRKAMHEEHVHASPAP